MWRNYSLSFYSDLYILTIFVCFIISKEALSSGPHQQPLSSPAHNHFGERYDSATFTIETANHDGLLDLNSSSSSKHDNSNSQHQQQQFIIDTSSLSTKTSNEWKLLQQHDWGQQLEIHNNEQSFSCSVSTKK